MIILHVQAQHGGALAFLCAAMAHPWMDSTRPVYPGTVREGYLIKSPPLDKKGVKVSTAV